MRERIIQRAGAMLLVVAGLALFVRFWGDLSAGAATRLTFGWLFFLGDVSSRIQINWDGVATVAVSLLLIYLGLHSFLRWLSSASTASQAAPARIWKKRWTASLVAVVVLMFATGTAFIGVVHQVGWLATSRSKLTTYRLNLGPYHSRLNNLNQIAGAYLGYRENFRALPTSHMEKVNHSWQTRLLAWGLYYDTYTSGIHYDLDWDHEENREAFRRFVPEFLNPEIGELRNAQGRALSHYAGNVHVLNRPTPLMPADVSDGESNTILAGQCATDFKPWGDPANLRDPADGINKLQGGFGSPSANGAQFAMLDGSVRFISAHIDPSVLTALATPATSDPLPDDWKSDAQQVWPNK